MTKRLRLAGSAKGAVYLFAIVMLLFTLRSMWGFQDSETYRASNAWAVLTLGTGILCVLLFWEAFRARTKNLLRHIGKEWRAAIRKELRKFHRRE